MNEHIRQTLQDLQDELEDLRLAYFSNYYDSTDHDRAFDAGYILGAEHVVACLIGVNDG